MTRARTVVPLVVLAAGLHTSCGWTRSRTPQPKGQTTVVLLPESDGSVGRAIVSNPAGVAELGTPRAATSVVRGAAPQPVTDMSEQDVQRLFGAALAAQPPAPAHFTLFFQFDSDVLTDESRQLVSQVVRSLKDYPAPQVTVVGHTDTAGEAAANVKLGLQRANSVRATLMEAGLDGAAIDVTSHGESTLLVPTADEVYEPKNRRVDITVR